VLSISLPDIGLSKITLSTARGSENCGRSEPRALASKIVLEPISSRFTGSTPNNVWPV